MRALSEIEKRILSLIEPDTEALGFNIVRLRLMGGRTPRLQIMAEREDGTMGVEDCADLSRAISPVLDVEDPIKGEYHLEVSSPGIDRPLTRPGDFANWVGHEVRVEIGMPIDGRRRFHGWIAGEENAVVFLKLKDGGEAEIPIIEMVKAHLVLTDELIEDAQSRGQALDAPEDDSDEYDEVEVETDPVDAPAEEGEKT
ncbi:MAG: ribosome maturation factor RimP [Pseudomonadota bacterium]